jgi:hypothetical protein
MLTTGSSYPSSSTTSGKGLGLYLDLDGRSSAHGSDVKADGEDFFLPWRLTGEVSLPEAAAAEAALRRAVIANARRMLSVCCCFRSC